MPYTKRQQLISTHTIAEIARQVHHEETPKLISRKFLFGSFDLQKNLWRDLPNQSDICPYEYSDVPGITPRIVCLTDLRKMDSATVPNNPVADDPNTMRDETQQAAQDGVNVIAPITQIQAGKRNSDQILVHALGATVRLRVVRTANDEYTDKVTFKFGFYQWTKITNTGELDNTAVPQIATICRWEPIGYSAQIDNITEPINIQGIPHAVSNLNMILNSEKVKVLDERTVTVNISSITNTVNCRLINMYKRLKNPIKIMYDPLSPGPYAPHLNTKIFFACRSNLPGIQVANIEPHLMACTKMYYSNFQ